MDKIWNAIALFFPTFGDPFSKQIVKYVEVVEKGNADLHTAAGARDAHSDRPVTIIEAPVLYVHKKNYFIGISSKSCFSARKQFPVVMRKRIPQLISLWFARVLPVPLETMFTGHTERQLGENEIFVDLFAFPKSEIEQLLARIQTLGGKCQSIFVRNEANLAHSIAWDQSGAQFGKTQNRHWLFGFIVIATILAMTVFLVGKQFNDRLDDAILVEVSEQAKASQFAKDLKAKIEQLKLDATENTILEKRLARSRDFSRTIEELAKISPNHTWFHSVSFETGKGFRVEGMSRNPEEFVSNLQRSEIFSAVRPQSAFLKNGQSGATTFEISLELK